MIAADPLRLTMERSDFSADGLFRLGGVPTMVSSVDAGWRGPWPADGAGYEWGTTALNSWHGLARYWRNRNPPVTTTGASPR